MSVAISLLKRASAGSGLRRLGGALGSGAKKVVRGAADLGAGVAEGVGVMPALGAAAGVGAVGLGTVAAGKAVKDKVDNWRLQHGLYPVSQAGYY